MPGGKGNIRPEDNPKPFVPGKSGNPKGPPPSIKKKVKELLALNGTVDIKKTDVILTDDGYFYKMKIPTKEIIAMKLFSWAMSNNPSVSLKAIEMILLYVDGKPLQSIDIGLQEPIQQVELTDDQFEEVMNKLIP